MQKSILGIVLVVFAAWAMQSCTANKLEVLEAGNLCFEDEILPIFISNCASPGCHNSQDRVNGRDYSTYEGIIEDIQRRKPGKSELVEVMRDFTNQRMPPPPRQPVPDEQIAVIEAWINTGALRESGCQTINCDSVSNVSYSLEVSPIIKLRCQGCHTTTAPSGGVELDSFEFVQAYALNGSLLGSIIGDVNYVQMPWNAPPLSDCEIKTIRIWVEEGALEN